MNKQLTVSQLNNYIKGVFEDELILQNICVTGEIFEFKTSGSNSYITLKDGDSTLSCIYFSSVVDYPVGTKAAATGTVKFYPKSGKLFFVIKSISLSGQGELIAKLKELRRKLDAEGVFANNRPLKNVIGNIAIITSGEGAVIHDFISVLKPLSYVNITIFSVKVQGVGARDEIVNTLAEINAKAHGDFDVIVIARGGGSSTDLDEFNSEALARGVFTSSLPVISAVGHEIDYTLCDYAADHRAGTPSIAAEMIVKNNAVFFQGFFSVLLNIKSGLTSLISAKSKKLFFLAQKTNENMGKIADSTYKRCARSCYNMQVAIEKAVQERQNKLKRHLNNVMVRLNKNLSDKESLFKVLCARADAYSPLKVLSKGYAKVRLGGAEIKSVDEINVGDGINIVMADGQIDAAITGKRRR